MSILPKTKVSKTSRYSLANVKKIQSCYDEYAPLLFENAHAFHAFKGFEQRKFIYYMDTFTCKIKRNRLGLYVCNVHIQGKELTFLLDTGAQISGILEKRAKSLKTTSLQQDVSVGSIGGKSTKSKCVSVDAMYFGALLIENQPLVVLDDKNFSIPYVNVKLMNFDGILGWDILSNFDFEIDDVNKQFSLLKMRDNFYIQNFIPTSFPCLCLLDQNKQPVIFGFDSGAKESWLAKEYMEQAHLDVEHDQKAYGIGVLGIEAMELWIAKELDLFLYDHKIALEKVISGRVDMFRNVRIAGVLGNKIFRGRKIQVLSSKRYIRIL